MSIILRAVKEEQKEERRIAILKSAKDLFEHKDLKEISMDDVSKKSGLAKGTLFFYFKTKEGLFLAMAEKEIGQWFKFFNEQLLSLKEKPAGLEEIINLFNSSLENNFLVIKLFSLLDSTLEKNIDFKTAYKFKSFLRDNIVKSGELIENHMSFLKKDDGIKVILFAYIIIKGIYPMAYPSQVVCKVIEKPGMEVFSIDFRKTFFQMMIIFLNGLKNG